jgi:hypothetical protein
MSVPVKIKKHIKRVLRKDATSITAVFDGVEAENERLRQQGAARRRRE